jgi:hypothetical protein
MPGHTGVSVPCRRCRRNVYFELDEHPQPEPKESWWARLRTALTGEVRLFDSGFAPPLDQQPREAADPELLELFTPPNGKATKDLTALRELAAVIDWRSDADEVLEPLAAAAAAWVLEPLWSEDEAEAWRNTPQLFTWQLVDELVSRFEAKGLRAFDTESRADGYGLLFIRAEHENRATELVTTANPAGDFRPFKRRKFE